MRNFNVKFSRVSDEMAKLTLNPSCILPVFFSTGLTADLPAARLGGPEPGIRAFADEVTLELRERPEEMEQA